LRFALLISLCLASPLLASATLTPADANVPGPYRPAVLTLSNDTNATIERISLQWELGGPRVETAVLLPAGQSRELPLLLPAMDRQQTFQLRLNTAPPQEIAITWPDGWADRAPFFDLALYRKYAEQTHQTPPSHKRNLLLTLVVGVLALGAATFLRSAKPRIVICSGLLLATAGGAWFQISSQPTHHRLPLEHGALSLLSVSRTQPLSVAPGDQPIYANRRHLKGDTLTLTLNQGTITAAQVDLAPGEIRLFRTATR
jgi:hypothetical protein